MIDQPGWSIEYVTGFVLVLGSVAALPGLMMFWVRGGHRGGAPRSRAHFVWERSFMMAAVVLTAIGFMLLEDLLQNSGGHVLATIGAAAYLFGGVLIVAAEALSLTWEYEKVYGLAVIYVVVAFLGQSPSATLCFKSRCYRLGLVGAQSFGILSAWSCCLSSRGVISISLPCTISRRL